MTRNTAIAVVVIALLGVGQAARGDALGLEELAARALARSDRLRARRMESRRASTRVDEARAQRWAKIKLDAFVGPSPDIDCVGEDCITTAPDEPRVALEGVFGGVALELTQPLYTFGKIGAATNAAQEGVAAAEALEDVTEAEVVLDVHRAFYGLQLARELIVLFEEADAQVADAHQRVATGLEEQSGDYTVTDRLRLETLAAEVTTRLSEARQGEREALAALRFLAGPDVEIAEEPLTPVDVELPAQEQFAAKSAQTRPEMRAARLGAEARASLVKLEERRRWPDLAIYGALNLSAAQGVDNPPSAFANDPFNRSSVALGVVLRWAFDPAQGARIDRERAAHDAARAQVGALGRALALDAERTLVQARALQERMASTSKGTRAARGWRTALIQTEAVGATETKALVDAYISYFTMRAAHLRSIHDWNVTVAKLRTMAAD